MPICNRPLTAICLTALWLLAIVIGCDGNSKENSPVDSSNSSVDNSSSRSPSDVSTKIDPLPPEAIDSKKGKSAKASPPVDGWKKPALAIVLSGEQHGYIEPCGCTENQSGGVSRRADLVRQLKEKGWTVTGIDLGGTIKRSRRQSQIKFETMLNAMRDMQYQALALGPEELRLSPEYILSQHATETDDSKPILNFIAANVVFFDSPDLGTPMPWKLVKVADLKIAVTAILGQSLFKTVLPEGSNSDISFLDPEKALEDVLPKIEDQSPDLIILLSHASQKESEKLAKAFPQFDLILTAGGPEDGHIKPTTVGKTMIVDIGHKGKHAGVVGYYPDDVENRLRFELVDLDQQRFKDSPKMIEHMREYQNRLKEERIVAIEHLEHSLNHPSGAKFVGAEKCGECHTRSYEKWKETAHANAFDSLEHARKGLEDYGITRVYDAECLACHVTGWDPEQFLRYKSGFVNNEFARDESEKQMALLLKGQQCESCHGPGSKHIELIETDKMDEAIKAVRVTLTQAKEGMCYSCHDLDNSPHFEFDSYWKKVAHPWSD